MWLRVWQVSQVLALWGVKEHSLVLYNAASSWPVVAFYL